MGCVLHAFPMIRIIFYDVNKYYDSAYAVFDSLTFIYFDIWIVIDFGTQAVIWLALKTPFRMLKIY